MDAYQVCKEFKIWVETEAERFRAETFETKEPETVAWIRDFIKDGDAFLDIGGNIGIYSLCVASLYPRSFTISFEPFLANYLRLEENIKLNGLTNIRAFQAAFGNQTRLVNFYSPKIEAGSSGGQVGSTKDEHGKPFNYMSMEQIPVYRVDDFFFFFKIPPPKHIKIDVDGQEEQVLAGATNILGNVGVKSVLVERNELLNKEILMRFMTNMHFTDNNVFNKMENHSRVRRAKEGITAENIIFTRMI